MQSMKNNGGYDKLIIHGASIMNNKIGRFSCIAIPQETLISDLSLTEENLWGPTTKTLRNEINRSKRENVGIKIYRGKEISDAILDEFNKMYHAMYEEKGMLGYYLPINELKAYAANDALVITTAIIGDRSVVYHSYITDNAHSRFLHSCSEFRVVDKAMKNAIG